MAKGASASSLDLPLLKRLDDMDLTHHRESAHNSKADGRLHYSGYQLTEQGRVLATKHFVVDDVEEEGDESGSKHGESAVAKKDGK